MTTTGLQEWASAVEFHGAPNWGEVEARILREPLPPQSEMKHKFRFETRTRAAIGYAILSPFILLTAGSGLTALVAVLLHLNDVVLPEWVEVGLMLVMLSTIVMPVLPIMSWLDHKRRGWASLFLQGEIAVFSAASFLLLARAPDIYRIGVWANVQLFALISVAVGVGSFLLLLLAGKPRLRSPMTHYLRRTPVEERMRQVQRRSALNFLVARGFLIEADANDMAGLPLGTWHQLVSLPDGRVVRKR